MAVIKIPSSNIYNIEDNNSLIKQNKITKAEVSANKFTTESGNVLSKEYVSTFWQEKRSEDIDGGISFTYVGGDSSLNEILYNVSPSISTISPLNFLDDWKKLTEPNEFETFPIDEQVYATPKSKNVKLAISDKTLLVQTDKNNNNRVTNYTLRRKARYWGFNSKENREYYFEEETSNLPLAQPLYYDSSDNTFVYNYLDAEIYERTKHVIKDTVGDDDEYYVTIECL